MFGRTHFSQYRFQLPMTPDEKARRRHSRKTRAAKRAKRKHKANVKALAERTLRPFNWQPVEGRPGLFQIAR